MVNLTRICTKTGDDGTTSLGDMSRTSKNDTRVEAFATVDEANSYIGVVLLHVTNLDIRKVLLTIQNNMFDLGADLSTPCIDEPRITPLRITKGQINYIENQVDKYNSDLQPLRSFVLPSGTAASSHLHVARSMVRKAERRVWEAITEYGAGVNPLTAIYLNRLSDLLFVLARIENLSHRETIWRPGK